MRSRKHKLSFKSIDNLIATQVSLVDSFGFPSHGNGIVASDISSQEKKIVSQQNELQKLVNKIDLASCSLKEVSCLVVESTCSSYCFV